MAMRHKMCREAELSLRSMPFYFSLLVWAEQAGNVTATRLFYCVYAAQQSRQQFLRSGFSHAFYLLMCALEYYWCASVLWSCVCVFASVSVIWAPQQRLNLFSTKLSHQKFANNNVGVIYLTHVLLLARLLFGHRKPQLQQNRKKNTFIATVKKSMVKLIIYWHLWIILVLVRTFFLLLYY